MVISVTGAPIGPGAIRSCWMAIIDRPPDGQTFRQFESHPRRVQSDPRPAQQLSQEAKKTMGRYQA